MMKNKEYYHYTTLKGLFEIIESGKINLSTANLNHKKEKPVAWVSTNPDWEVSATKVWVTSSGQIIFLSFEQQLEIGGCARIKVRNRGLMNWAKLKHVARMNLFCANNMESIAGGKPREWFGSMFPIGKEKWICAEIYENGEWKTIQTF